MTKVEELGRELWHVTGAKGAASQDELAARASPKMGWMVTASHIAIALAWVRDHEEELGWTIPEVVRGPGFPGRYFRMLVDRDGTCVLDDETKAANLDGGGIGSLLYMATKARRQGRTFC